MKGDGENETWGRKGEEIRGRKGEFGDKGTVHGGKGKANERLDGWWGGEGVSDKIDIIPACLEVHSPTPVAPQPPSFNATTVAVSGSGLGRIALTLGRIALAATTVTASRRAVS